MIKKITRFLKFVQSKEVVCLWFLRIIIPLLWPFIIIISLIDLLYHEGLKEALHQMIDFISEDTVKIYTGVVLAWKVSSMKELREITRSL